MSKFEYSGDELALFSTATNWKAYWSSEIMPFVGDYVLDVGAGIGATANTLNSKKYKKWVGLEPDKKLCAIIDDNRTRGLIPAHLELRHGTLADLSPDEKFDTVLYVDVLEHIKDDKEELARAERHLLMGGHIIIVVPAHNFLYTDFDKRIGHFRRYDKKLLHSAIPETLAVKRIRYLDSLGMIASLANKLVLKSDTPTAPQIRFWDSVLVRGSYLFDFLLGYQVGKSMVCVLQKPIAKSR